MSQVGLESSSQAVGPETQALLSVRDLKVTFFKERGLFLRKRYEIRAVDGVSLNLNEGEFVSVVGETGSGKTTLARCILGLASPDGGSIKYRGLEVTQLGWKSLRKYRKRVQMIFQDPYESLNPNHDVYKILSTPIRFLLGETNRQRIAEKISNVLLDVGLDPREVMHRFPHQLSGGQRQRVNIARALAPEPELLIADEPITMLDSEQRANILLLLRRLKEERKLTVLMITHDLASAGLISDRIVVMYLGKIVEVGDSKEIISSPHHPYVELILSAAPKIKRDWMASSEVYANMPSLEDTIYLQSRGCVFAPRCKYATDVCKENEPKLEKISGDHSAACYHPVNA